MPPKSKKTKAEEALAFLSDLDNFEAPPPTSGDTLAPSAPQPRLSVESTRASGEEPPQNPAADDEAASALAFLEEQIKQKRAPLSKPSVGAMASGTPRTASPQHGGAPSTTGKVDNPATAPDAAQSSSGWGVSSFWSSATSALQSAQRVADEQYRKVRTEGVAGVRGQLDQLQVGGVDLAKLRKDAEERLGGIVTKVGTVDLDKLRHDLLEQANSTISTIINTVAPPISAHETIELWFSHPMVGYEGVEGVVYRAWTTILEQTESGELVIVWSKPDKELPSERTLNPTTGWDVAWKAAHDEVANLRSRESSNPRARPETSPESPVTTVPVFLHLQPVLAPLPIPEPPMMLTGDASRPAPSHLYFIVSLQDPSHDLQFTTVSQPSPGDWLNVDYDKSDWVEERLVEVIRTSVEIVAQDYVATRMSLKPTSVPSVGPSIDSQDVVKPAPKGDGSTPLAL